MGRESKGKTQNESKNLHKWLKDSNWEPTPLGTETLRSLQTPSTFAEASLLAMQRQDMRDASFSKKNDHVAILSPAPRPSS